jgi:choline-sulfatase
MNNTANKKLGLRLLPAVVLGLATATQCLPAADQKPLNILFIAVDDLRPELGCYGNPVVKSPNIDALAKRGTTFTSAYCQQAVCSPSRSSLMTGRYPDATKVWDLKTHFRVALPDAVTVAQLFKQNGYHAASLGKIFHHGFDDGASWSEPAWYATGLTVDTDPQDFRKRKTVRFGPGVSESAADGGDNDADSEGGKAARKKAAFEASSKAEDELPDGATAAEAIRRLQNYKKQGQPFFLAVGFIKPHLPFVAPKKYWDLYDPAKIPVPAIDDLPAGAPEFAGHQSPELHAYGNIPAGNPIPTGLARELRHGYYAAISYMDAQVGRVLDALEKEGLADNTVIVLWGDHGWQLGEHGLWTKHTNFEIATRAPLIISLPKQKAAGTKSASLVEFVDIYPTLAYACGLKTPAGLDGVSLMPVLANPSASVRKVAMSQFPRGGGAGAGRNLMGYSIRDPQWRMTLWRDNRDGSITATELYDEKNDPAETVNVADKNPEIVKRLSAFVPPLKVVAKEAKPVNVTKQTAAVMTNSATVVSQSTSTGAAKPPQDRAEMFKQKDRDRSGSLNQDEFLANQADADAAKNRFEKWDTDQNGSLSQEEFLNMGKVLKP